jgi:hypothetical protein
VGVNHGGFYIGVAQQLLHRPNILATLQQMRCETVPQCMGRSQLNNACHLNSTLEATLKSLLIEVMTSNGATAGINR